MERLTVLYDADCELCRGARAWLARQAQWVPLEFVAAGSPEAARRFPTLDAAAQLRELHVIDERGRLWRGDGAWLLCLWALREYRAWALRLARPGLRGRARRLVAWVSRNRRRLRRPAAPAGVLS